MRHAWLWARAWRKKKVFLIEREATYPLPWRLFVNDESLATFLDTFATNEQIAFSKLVELIGDREATNGFVDAFDLLGLVKREGPNVRAVERWEYSRLYFRALSERLALHDPLFGDFTRSGQEQSWVRALEATERPRSGRSGAPVIREQFAAQIVIVGISNSGERFLLMDRDETDWGTYRLVGGKSRTQSIGRAKNPEGAVATIQRELGEEIGHAYSDVFEVDPISFRADLRRVSKRLGAFTLYAFTFFRVQCYHGAPFSYDGERRGQLRWVKIPDIDWALQSAPHLVAADILRTPWIQEAIHRPAVCYEIREADLSRVVQRRRSEEFRLAD